MATAHPVQTLREHSTNFEAALSVCLGDPKVKAVHTLRTESRRLEAQMALLASVENLPPFRTEAAKAKLQIKKLRRAAGRVRDLDVQSHRLRQYAGEIRASSMPDAEKQPLIADIETMVATREERRSRQAAKLVDEIDTRQAKVAAALERLNSALKHAAGRSLASTELLAAAQRLFEQTHALKVRRPSIDDLHSVRKAAKRARYMVENAGAKPALVAARRYEHLQDLGGEWHDWLDLAAAAREELGKKHAAAVAFLALRDHNLERYRTGLEGFRPANAKPAARAKKQAPIG